MKQYLLYLLLPLLLIGCSNDDDSELTAPKPQPTDQITFDLSIGDQTNTRTTTDTDFNTEWVIGDEVGIFAVKSGNALAVANNYIHNVKLSYDGTSWTGDLYWPNTGENYDFYAYYPYNDNGGTPESLDPTNIAFGVETDQSTESDYNQSDLLLASETNVTKSSTAVNLTFSHALSLVQVEISREVNVSPFTDDLEVTLTNALPQVALSWGNTLTGKGTLSDIVMHKVAGLDYTYRALVPAQTLSNSKITFIQSTTDKKIALEYQGLQSTTLTASQVQKYAITLGWGINPDHVYAVGDKYPHVGPCIGIVYEMSNGGKNGKVVSLDKVQNKTWGLYGETTGATNMTNGMENMQTIAGRNNWNDYPAFAWVHNKNSAAETYSNPNAKGIWYLPAKDELTGLYTAYNSYGKTAFNAKLTAAGGSTFSSDFYWSSSEYNDNNAWAVCFDGGSACGNAKFDALARVRCVFAF